LLADHPCRAARDGDVGLWHVCIALGSLCQECALADELRRAGRPADHLGHDSRADHRRGRRAGDAPGGRRAAPPDVEK